MPGMESPSVVDSHRIAFGGSMARFTDQLRRAILASRETLYAIEQGSGVARSQLSRFLNGTNRLSVDSVERVADYLRLRIKLERRGKRTKGR